MSGRAGKTAKPGPKRAQKRALPPDEAYHHGDLRATLIAGALELIAERGAQNLSLREVARRAGVSHAAPYRHFSDKNALLSAIALDGFRMLTRALEQSRIPGKPRESYLASGIAYVRFALANPAHVAVMFGSVVERPEECEGLPEEGAQAFTVLVGLIEEAQAAGVLRPGSSRTLALASWSLVHGLAMLADEKGAVPPEQAEEITRTLTEILFSGMQARPDSRQAVIPHLHQSGATDRSTKRR